jgi:REP element-mobilizing transposase RayT
MPASLPASTPLPAPRGHLPRLEPAWYRGRAVVFWTHTIADRRRGWLTPAFHAAFREIMLHAAAREGLLCPIYTLMPDHFHLIWMGTTPTTDQRRATAFLRSQLKPHLGPARLQHQAHDHVLRDEERKKGAFVATCTYLSENPVRACLAPSGEVWPFTGCIVAGYPTLHPLASGFWDKFWKIYAGATALAP